MTNISEVMIFIGTVCHRGFFLVTCRVKITLNVFTRLRKHNEMLIAQCARVIFVHRLFLFRLLFVTTIESKLYFIDSHLNSRLLCKIQGFQGLEFDPIKFKAIQDFQGPVQTLHTVNVLETPDTYHSSTPLNLAS